MTCRVCHTETIPWLDLGEQKLANALTRPNDPPLPSYPLAVERCPTCGLSQLTYIVPPEALYTVYPYYTGVSVSYWRHLQTLVDDLRNAGAQGPAIDIASNDGTLVRLFMRDFDALGIEPSENLAAAANDQRIPTRRGYFPHATADFPSERWGILTSLNVLGHVADPHAFAAEAARLLRPNGIWLVEVPKVGDLLQTGAFDTIYHEHLSYWSMTALARLGAAHGLRLSRISQFAHHGGTVQAWFTKTGPEAAIPPEPVVFSDAAYVQFREKVKARIERFWETYLAHDGRWAGYGAAAKGSVFAQAAGITNAHLVYVVDETPDKQGRRTAYHVPVVSRLDMQRDPPDHVVIFAWNMADEIRAKIPRSMTVVTTL